MPVDIDDLVNASVIDVWGRPATFRPRSGGAYAVSVVFFDAFRQVVILDGEAGVTTTDPKAGVKLSDLAALGAPAPKQNDRLEVGSIRYVINNAEPDGEGWSNLELSIASGST